MYCELRGFKTEPHFVARRRGAVKAGSGPLRAAPRRGRTPNVTLNAGPRTAHGLHPQPPLPGRASFVGCGAAAPRLHGTRGGEGVGGASLRVELVMTVARASDKRRNGHAAPRPATRGSAPHQTGLASARGCAGLDADSATPPRSRSDSIQCTPQREHTLHRMV